MTLEDRMKRAGDYVLGRMEDIERERAERDLEVDPEFRECVLRTAQRLHVIESPGSERIWHDISGQIAGLPHMPGLSDALHAGSDAGMAHSRSWLRRGALALRSLLTPG